MGTALLPRFDLDRHFIDLARIDILCVAMLADPISITSFPDNNEQKTICLQAAGHNFPGVGERHVALFWINHGDEFKDMLVHEIIHVVGGPGHYSFDHIAKFRNERTLLLHDIYELGEFSRDQRDRIIQLAGEVQFDPTSRVNGCRVWMRDLLQAMVSNGLIEQDMFAMVNEEIPLLVRRSET